MSMVDDNDELKMKLAWNQSREFYKHAVEDYARGKDSNNPRGGSAAQGKIVSADVFG